MINIAREYIFHIRILDTERHALVYQQKSFFRGQRFLGLYSVSGIRRDTKFRGFLVVFRRN